MERDCCFGLDPQLIEAVLNTQPIKKTQPQSVPPVKKKVTEVVRVVAHE